MKTKLEKNLSDQLAVGNQVKITLKSGKVFKGLLRHDLTSNYWNVSLNWSEGNVHHTTTVLKSDISNIIKL